MAVVYVGPSGNNNNSKVQAGNISTPWKTIQYAVENVVAGDIIKVLSGTYNEHISITSGTAESGTSESPITLMSNDPSNPGIITATQTIYHQLAIYDRSYWVIDGLSFLNFESGGIRCHAETENMVGIVIQNCKFDGQLNESGYWSHTISMGGNEPYSISYSYILNNWVGNVTTGPNPNGGYNECITVYWSAHHILVQGNVIENSSYLTFDIISKHHQYGDGLCHHIILDHNTVLSSKSDNYNNNNGYKIDGGDYIVIQNNKGYNIDFCASGSEPWGDVYKLYENDPYKYHLWRNNIWDTRNYPTGANYGAFLGSDRFVASGAGSYGWQRNLYFVHNFLAAKNSSMPVMLLSVGWNVKIKNNVIWHDGNGASLVARYYSAWNSFSSDFRTSGWEWAKNLYYTTALPLWEYVDGSGYWSGTPGAALAGWKASVEPTAQWGLPSFNVNTYFLTSSSVGYQDSSVLTTATNSGVNSTTLIVADAGYFCDGFGLIAGDTIYVNGVEASITSVNYDTNTLTLESPISWTNGAGIKYLPNPSIGILEQAGSNGDIITGSITANAGTEQIIFDFDDNGSASVTLDASNSSSTNPIVSYEWSTTGGVTIPDGVNPTATFPVGDYVVTLLITDDENNTDSDTVNISVKALTDNACDNNLIINGNFATNNLSGWETYSNAVGGNTDPCQSNIILNGNFATNNLNNWTFVSGGASSATAATGAAVVTVNGPTASTQLMQTGLNIVAGYQYTLKFDAKCASGTNQFETSIIQNNPDYANVGIGYQTTNLTTTMQTFEYTFVATLSEADARLRFYFTPSASGSITIDNVCLGVVSEISGDTFTGVTGKFVADLTGTGTEVYLQQLNKSVISGVMYEVKFDIDGTNGETVEVKVADSGGTSLGLSETINVTTGVQSLSYQFIANASTTSAKLYFDLSSVEGIVNIDNVCFGPVILYSIFADFTYLPANPIAYNDTVVFSDASTSSNPIDTWDWNFGDGSPHSSLQNPTHIYTQDGTYDVTLTITNEDGSNNITKQISISYPVLLYELPNVANKYIMDAYGNVTQIITSSKLYELFNTMNLTGMVHISYNIFTGLGIIYEPATKQYLYFNIDTGEYIVENNIGATIFSGTSALLSLFGAAHELEFGAVTRGEQYWDSYQLAQNSLYQTPIESLPDILNDQIVKLGTI